MNIEKALELKKMTKSELARMVGKHYTSIHKIVNRKRRPSPELAKEIAEILKPYITRMEILYPDEFK